MTPLSPHRGTVTRPLPPAGEPLPGQPPCRPPRNRYRPPSPGTRCQDTPFTPPTEQRLPGPPPRREPLPAQPFPHPPRSRYHGNPFPAHREPPPGRPRPPPAQEPLPGSPNRRPPSPGAVTGPPQPPSLAREPSAGAGPPASPVLELLVVVLVRVVDLLVRHPGGPPPSRQPPRAPRLRAPRPLAPPPPALSNAAAPRSHWPAPRSGRASRGGERGHWSALERWGGAVAPLPRGSGETRYWPARHVTGAR